MHKLIFLVILLLFVESAAAQRNLNWSDLADVDFKPEYNEKYDVHFLVPKFGESIKAYDGKAITITGYFLDISGTGEVLLVSANPMASCFFCGAAGPESIIEVNFNEKPSFATDDVIQVTGTLELNRDDINHCNYILQNASGKLIN